MTERSNGQKLWDLVVNTDFEESIRGRLDMEEATDEEMVEALEGYNKEDILEEHLTWIGCGLEASDIRWMLDMLEVFDEYSWDAKMKGDILK